MTSLRDWVSEGGANLTEVSRSARLAYHTVWRASQGEKLRLDKALKLAEATGWRVAMASVTKDAEILERYVVFRLNEHAKSTVPHEHTKKTATRGTRGAKAKRQKAA